MFILKYPEDYEFNLDMHGLKVIAYKNTVAGYDDKCEVNIEARIGEKYTFPKNARLVSGVYKISISGSQLTKPLKIGIQHSVELRTPSQTKWLRFAISSSNKCSFTLFKGEFSVGDKYGYIERKKFSKFSVVEVSDDGPPIDRDESNDSSNSDSSTDDDEPRQQQPLYVQQPIEHPSGKYSIYILTIIMCCNDTGQVDKGSSSYIAYYWYEQIDDMDYTMKFTAIQCLNLYIQANKCLKVL